MDRAVDEEGKAHVPSLFADRDPCSLFLFSRELQTPPFGWPH